MHLPLSCSRSVFNIKENNPEWPVERIKAEGYGDDVVHPLELLTKGKGDDFLEYIKRLGEDPDARAIKLLDMEHNLSDDPIPKQVTKYTQAMAYLATKYAA